MLVILEIINEQIKWFLMISDIIVKYAFWNTGGSSGDVEERV